MTNEPTVVLPTYSDPEVRAFCHIHGEMTVRESRVGTPCPVCIADAPRLRAERTERIQREAREAYEADIDARVRADMAHDARTRPWWAR